MRLSIKYEEKLNKQGSIDVLDIGVISTEIFRLKTILKDVGINPKDENIERLKLWKN